jgi:hypothetical protein
MNNTRILGIVLSVMGLGIAFLAGLWLATQVSSEALSSGGAVLGAVFAFIPVILLLGGGLYLYLRGGAETQQQSEMHLQRRIMDAVASRGQVTVQDLALELGTPVERLKDLVHQLVGLQVFSGYINWEEGTLYSMDAQQLRELKQCKNCGGELKLAGKGVVACPFCGTEYFLR